MTAGVGFTVMVYVVAVPIQLFAVGVTVMVAVTGVSVAFVAVNELIFPVPLADKPIEVLLLVHVYVVPETAEVKFTAAFDAVLQTV